MFIIILQENLSLLNNGNIANYVYYYFARKTFIVK